jgi:nardilysin
MFLQTRRNFQTSARVHLLLLCFAEDDLLCPRHGLDVSLLDDRKALHVGETLPGSVRGSRLSAVQRGEGNVAEAQRIQRETSIITKDLHAISAQIEPTVFETYRKQFKKYIYNNIINSKFLNKDCRLNIVEEHHKFFFDRYIEADKVTFEQLVTFSKEFLQQLKVQILVQGNIERATAEEITNCVIGNLKCREIDGKLKIDSRAVKLPQGQNTLRVKSILPNDKNSTTTSYIQIGPSTIRLQCLIEFIEKVMEEPLFDILRTQEQLGYSISCSHRFNHGILGISVTIQSQEDKNPTTIVEKRIEKFLHENLATVLDKMTDEEFETIQTALIKLKNMVEVELESEVNRHWSEITSREYIFNRLELEAQMIAQLTKQDVVNFYKEKIIAADARKLSIQIVGSGNGEEIKDEESYEPQLEVLVDGEGSVIKDMEAFKNSLEMHPVKKTVIDL